MFTRSRLFKAAALVSSILLVAGFVSYRAGAFNWLTHREPVWTTESTADPNSPTFISGSKFIVLKPGAATSDIITIKIDPKSPVFMSGSKSIILVEPAKDGTPVPVVPAAPQTK